MSVDILSENQCRFLDVLKIRNEMINDPIEELTLHSMYKVMLDLAIPQFKEDYEFYYILAPELKEQNILDPDSEKEFGFFYSRQLHEDIEYLVKNGLLIRDNVKPYLISFSKEIVEEV